MAKLSELLVATLATAALVACGEDSTTKEGDQDVGVSGGGSGGSGGNALPGGSGGNPMGGSGGAPVGGTPVGGTPEGGSGGTPVGGSGGEGGTPLPPPPAGCQEGDAVCTPGGPSQAICDTDPCDWPAEANWSPAARVTFINVPHDKDCAAAAGCRLIGTQNGTALAGLLPLLNQDAPPPPPDEECPDSGLSAFVQPDETGDIQLILLSRLLGVPAGQPFAATANADLQLFTGDPGASPTEWTIDSASFEPNTENPLIHFAGTSFDAEGRIHTPSSRFSLNIPVAGLAISLALEGSQVSGFAGIGTGNVGFKISNGLIGGYLTEDSIVSLIVGLQASCAAEDPPEFCSQLNSILPPGSCTPADCTTGISIITGILGKFEAKVDAAGTASACDPRTEGDCNAIGVCLQVEMQGTTITGISPPD